MTPILKRNINIILPALVAGYVMYRMDPGFKDPKRSVPVMLGVLIIAWIITNQITSLLLKQAQRPKPGEVPVSAEGFDERTFCTRLYNDITCIFCIRDYGLYKELARLTDAELLAVNRYWNDNYFDKVGESLRVAINGEWSVMIDFDTINKRFDNLKIQ